MMSNSFCVVEAELFAEHECLAGADHRDREQHVVADLRRLPRARAAGMDDALAHLLQDRLGARERLVAAAAHERERAGLRAARRRREPAHRENRSPLSPPPSCTARAESMSMVEQSISSASFFAA